MSQGQGVAKHKCRLERTLSVDSESYRNCDRRILSVEYVFLHDTNFFRSSAKDMSLWLKHFLQSCNFKFFTHRNVFWWHENFPSSLKLFCHDIKDKFSCQNHFYVFHVKIIWRPSRRKTRSRCSFPYLEYMITPRTRQAAIYNYPLLLKRFPNFWNDAMPRGC